MGEVASHVQSIAAFSKEAVMSLLFPLSAPLCIILFGIDLSNFTVLVDSLHFHYSTVLLVLALHCCRIVISVNTVPV